MLGFVTYFMIQFNLFQHISQAVYGDEEHLVSLFERVHFDLCNRQLRAPNQCSEPCLPIPRAHPPLLGLPSW